MTRPIFTRPWIAFDTETTGLPQDEWARVVEIGGVVVERDGSLGLSFSTLCRPHEPIDARADEALDINRIARADIAAAPPIEAAWSQFVRWTRTQFGYAKAEADARGAVHHVPMALAGWVSGFDVEMLLRDGCSFADVWPGHALTILDYQPIIADIHKPTKGRRYRLVHAAERCKVTLPEGMAPHRAIADCTLLGLTVAATFQPGFR